MYLINIIFQIVLNIGTIVAIFGLLAVVCIFSLALPDLLIMLFGKNED
jgi:hypothetical protein